MVKIMVVDDEEDVRISIKTILEKNGYGVILSIDGDDCLKKLQEVKPDLILMDVMMPGTKVKDVVSKINGIKIVYLTGIGTSSEEKENLMKSKNIADFIQKPFETNYLLEKVKNIVH